MPFVHISDVVMASMISRDNTTLPVSWCSEQVTMILLLKLAVVSVLFTKCPDLCTHRFCALSLDTLNCVKVVLSNAVVASQNQSQIIHRTNNKTESFCR